MNTRILLFAACLAASLALAADDLNVKTGLWELKSTTQMGGLPPLPPQVLAQMTPEQRAKLQETLQKQMQAPQDRTQKVCVTKEDLGRPFASLDFKNCSQTIVSRTSTTQEVNLSCTGNPVGTGTMRIAAQSAEEVTGTIDLTLGASQPPMTAKSQFQAHWLGADCGDAPRLNDRNDD